MSDSNYQQLIESIELSRIDLQSLECNQNKEFESEKKTNLDIALRNDIKTKKFWGLELQIQFEFEVIAFHNSLKEKQNIEDIAQEDILFEVKFVLNLDYYFEIDETEDVLEEFDEEIINTFVEKNVPLNAWPYARETISSITTRMGFPALVIPTYKNLSPS